MGQTKQTGAEIARLNVQPGADVLDKRGQFLVQQVSTGSTEVTYYDGFPQPGRISRSRTAVEYGRILA